jgi:hypothetical protein
VPNLPPTPAPAAFAPSRPFPRPAQGQAQQASSISQSQPQSQAQAQAQRASKRASISRNSGLADAARLRELRDLPTDKTTPAAALRRLQGEAPVTTPDISLSSLSSLSLSVLSSTPSPAPLPAPELARSGRTLSCSTVDAAEIDALMDGSEEGSAGAGSPPTVLKGTGAEQKSQQQQKEQADSAALAEQIAQLAQLVQALPRSVAQGVSAQQAAQAKTHTQAQSQAQTRDRARIEEQKAAMLEMLATAEKRADAREMRLQGMLADVSRVHRSYVLTITGKGVEWAVGVVSGVILNSACRVCLYRGVTDRTSRIIHSFQDGQQPSCSPRRRSPLFRANPVCIIISCLSE